MGFSDFERKVFETYDDRLCMITTSLEREIIAQGYDATMSNDAKRVFFLDLSQSLRMAIVGTNSRSEIIAENVLRYIITDDGYVYYVDNNNELYFKKITDSIHYLGTLLLEEVMGYSLELFRGDTVFFTTRGDTLWYSKGSEAEKVDNDVISVDVYNDNVVYQKKSGAVYRSYGRVLEFKEFMFIEMQTVPWARR